MYFIVFYFVSAYCVVFLVSVMLKNLISLIFKVSFTQPYVSFFDEFKLHMDLKYYDFSLQ